MTFARELKKKKKNIISGKQRKEEKLPSSYYYIEFKFSLTIILQREKCSICTKM